MLPVSQAFLSAIRAPHTIDVRVEAWRGGLRVGGTLQILDGSVTAEVGRSESPRRTLNLELLPAPGLWGALAPIGTTLYAWRGVRYVDGTVERVPLGVFDVDDQSVSASPGDGLQLTAPDVWVRVQRARFEKPRTTAAGNAHNLAVGLASEAIGLGTATLRTDSTATTRSAVWARDREEAITKLAHTAASWIYADTSGKVTSRAAPSLTQTPVWTVDASASGVLLEAERSRSRQSTYNVVVVNPSDSDGTAPFQPVIVSDDDPTSPTYAAGPFGRVPYFYSSQLITTTADAQSTAAFFLRRVKGRAATLDLTSAVNPALEPGDVIEVLLPTLGGDPPTVERHLIDSVTIPLTASGTQSIRTRSSRPEGDVPASE